VIRNRRAPVRAKFPPSPIQQHDIVFDLDRQKPLVRRPHMQTLQAPCPTDVRGIEIEQTIDEVVRMQSLEVIVCEGFRREIRQVERCDDVRLGADCGRVAQQELLPACLEAVGNYGHLREVMRRSFGAWTEDADELDEYHECTRRQRKQRLWKIEVQIPCYILILKRPNQSRPDEAV
jgi:hypothetical protein